RRPAEQHQSCTGRRYSAGSLLNGRRCIVLQACTGRRSKDCTFLTIGSSTKSAPRSRVVARVVRRAEVVPGQRVPGRPMGAATLGRHVQKIELYEFLSCAENDIVRGPATRSERAH